VLVIDIIWIISALLFWGNKRVEEKDREKSRRPSLEAARNPRGQTGSRPPSHPSIGAGARLETLARNPRMLSFRGAGLSKQWFFQYGTRIRNLDIMGLSMLGPGYGTNGAFAISRKVGSECMVGEM
jgi:hypothetical protein